MLLDSDMTGLMSKLRSWQLLLGNQVGSPSLCPTSAAGE